MKIVIFTFLFFLNLSANTQLDSLTLSKVEKTIQMEEEIAIAFKKYLIDNGKTPSIEQLKTDSKYLPAEFSTINPFGKTTTISSNLVISNIPEELKLKIYDYYYSDNKRTFTKEPLSSSSNEVRIILDTFEEFIFNNQSIITTVQNPINKYYLNNGVLHWYDLTGYKYSYNGELIVDKDVQMLNEDGTFTTTFDILTSNVRYAGQMILQESNAGVVEDYLATDNGAILLDEKSNDVGKTIIQFTRRAGGMIVNGDIYTWGNNANRITGLNKNIYTKTDGSTTGTGNYRFPVITTLVRAKVKTDYSYNYNYFSSPLRPKFIDFFSTVYTGTCGISTEGALYCGGSTGLDNSFGNNYTDTDSQKNGEMLYKSNFFDGSIHKAKKVFSNNQIWHILSEDGDVYRWGFDHSGFSGTGTTKWNLDYFNNVINSALGPEIIIIGTKIQDITYLLTIGYRKIGALSTDGDVYIWGVEDDNSNNQNCTEFISGVIPYPFNLCLPSKVEIQNSTMTEELTFETIKGGLESFIAKASNGNYYKIYQPKINGVVQKIQVVNINDEIKTYSNYNESVDSEILSLDISSKLVSGTLQINSGVVWVNGANELKGDYFTADNQNDNLFKDAISSIKWKQIKVIDDKNGMCGIDINNQMYCWGTMSYTRTGTSDTDKMGNTYMIPIFNTNLFDSNRDYMLAEGGESGYLTDMTSGSWESATDSTAFFMKYPTYIGGFNYEFEFK